MIASLNGTNIGGWVKYARLLEGAGADAVELNLYTVAADPSVDGADVEAEHLELVALVADEVGIPVAVKLSPYYSSLAAFVVAIQRAGASGVVMFNRFYSPDLDLETLDVMPRIALSTPEELRLPLRWIGIMREHLSMSIAGSTGCPLGIRCGQADPRRRRRGDVDVGDPPRRSCALRHDGGTAARMDGRARLRLGRARCAVRWRAMPRPIRPHTNGPTTSATSRPTPADSCPPDPVFPAPTTLRLSGSDPEQTRQQTART